MKLRTFLFAASVSVLGIACGSEAPDTSATNASEQPIPVAPSTDAAAVDANGVALNPEHGQPSHRCDIPVGAPLNSPPAESQSPLIQTQPAANTAAPTATTVAGTNPPHGQPNHRCDIAVGAPLN